MTSIRNDQARFCKDCLTLYRIHTINQVIEECVEYNQPQYIAFTDYENAFDSSKISAVVQALWDQGAAEPCVNVLEDIFGGSTATIVIHKECNKIATKKGIRQVYTISPRPFTASLQGQSGIRVSGKYISNLQFVMALPCQVTEVVLKVNMNKNKVMLNSPGKEQQFAICREAQEIHLLWADNDCRFEP